MNSKGGLWGWLLLMLVLSILVIIFYDYFTTPHFKILPLAFVFFFSFYNFFLKFGEYLGIALPALAKPNFITRGGLIGVYEKHEEHHSGMVSYYFTTYSRNLRHCNYTEDIEVGVIKRFFLLLTPTRMAKITDYAEMFEEVPKAASDCQENTIFYHGTLRGAILPTPYETMLSRFRKLQHTLSETVTYVEGAKATAEAVASGASKQMVDVSTQLSTALENISKHTKEEPIVLERREQK